MVEEANCCFTMLWTPLPPNLYLFTWDHPPPTTIPPPQHTHTHTKRPLFTLDRPPPSNTTHTHTQQQQKKAYAAEFTRRVALVPSHALTKALMSAYRGLSPQLVQAMCGADPGIASTAVCVCVCLCVFF